MRINLKNIGSVHLVIFGFIIAVSLSTAMCDFIQTENKSQITHPGGKKFAGSASCKSCHQSVFDTHKQTPHFLTSGPASLETIKGSFDSSKNVFELNDRLKVVMQKSPTGLFQAGFVDGWEVNRKPVDMVIGSGRKGQTYLYWEDDKLFQLPVSYYTPLDTWCNSPGYPTDQILFNRNISGRCLECHGTYLKSEKAAGQVERFDRGQAILGVDCERCHGPAADHVAFQKKYPEVSKAQHIVNPARLTRQQKLDNCALCHSGIRENIKPSFSFVVGDNLADYSLPDYSADSIDDLDVHGNQYGLLTASACFRISAMDCSSCHNVHVKETNQMELFSQRCMNCHNTSNHNFCKQPQVPGLVLSKNCIDCHMPALPSRQVFLQVSDTTRSTPDLVRTHLVGTYAEEIKLYLQKIKRDEL